MNSYTATFKGRLRGATGAMDHFCIEVKANSKEEALRELYKTHDHISFPVVTAHDTNPPCDIDRVNVDLDRSAECLDACKGIRDPDFAINNARAALAHVINTAELETIPDGLVRFCIKALALLEPRP